jgi:AcrR family transcriptional regulator
MARKSTSDEAHRSRRSRRAIYEAALALVREIGYPRTTIEDIAVRAGVGKQTIHRWWPSKADVLLEAFLDLGDRTAQGADADGGPDPGGIPDTGDLAADLRAALRATADELLDPRIAAPARALAAEGLVNERLGREYVAKLLEPRLARCARRLRSAQESGQVRREVDPRIALELLLSPLAQRWLRSSGPITHEYTDTLVDYALHGIAPRDGHGHVTGTT